METASVIEVGLPWGGQWRLLCECLESITLLDIGRGYHRCGRLLEVRVGPREFGAER